MEQVQLRLPPADVLKQLNLGFVQIFLNASIACILYTRRLINWQSSCFLARNVSQLILPESLPYLEDANKVHDRFCSAEYDLGPDHGESQEFKVMQRESHRCADQVLDMLSSGIMDSLQQDHLSIMKLFILGKRRQVDSIVETYTFVFQASGRAAPSVKLAETNEVFNVDNLQKSFKRGINSLLRSIRDLPQLPRHGRRLGVSLLYRQSCPSPYQPVGFIASTHDHTALWDNDHDTLQATMFDTGAITISISVQRSEGESDADRRLGTYLNTLQHTSSRDSNLPPTRKQIIPSSKRKRSNTDMAGPNNRSRTQFSAAHVASVPAPTSAQEEAPASIEDALTEKQRKISDSKALVHFSSQSTHHTVPSDSEAEAFM